jgi:beta-N-acetylhexosaminidase
LFKPYTRSILALPAIVSLVLQTALAAAPVHLDSKGEHWANATLHKMTIEEKIGQMIMPWARIKYMNTSSPDYVLLREEMRKYHVGGFGVTVFVDGSSLIKSEPFEAAMLTNSLQRDSKYPLLFGADMERGLSMRLMGATNFPPAMAFGATGDKELARHFGEISAQEARAVGIQWNWFPVADVNSNPANPIINTRSFGEDPQLVSAMLSAYIEGARSSGLLTTVKHFPGHGDTDTDSHLTLARVNASVDRLNKVELVPFRAAIAAGVDSVMLAHITVPSIEPDPNKPASISSNVVTGLLKGQLGFKGLVITDALDMGALTRVFTGTPAQISAAEAVAAIQAGNDMVIIPADLDGAYNGLLQAVRTGTISEKRVDESVLKILKIKASVGLDRNRYVDLNKVADEIAQPANIAASQQIADRAVTLVEDKNHLVPIAKSAPAAPSNIVAVIFCDSASSPEGTHLFAQQLRERVPDATIFSVDDSTASYMAADVLAAVAQAKEVIAVAEAVPAARRITKGSSGGSATLDQGSSNLLSGIVKAAGDKTIVVAFGNPYLGEQVPGIETYVCTFSNTTDSATSLLKALFGDDPIHGRLPVTIPNIAARGAGVDR